jgi:hypothetical protein
MEMCELAWMEAWKRGVQDANHFGKLTQGEERKEQFIVWYCELSDNPGSIYEVTAAAWHEAWNRGSEDK